VGHDLNNLLSAISLSAEYALSKSSPSDQVRQCLSDIFDAAATASTLTRQLIEIGRGPAEVQVLQFDRVVESFGGILRRLLGRGVELTMDLRADVPVRISVTHVRQILLNLADNARDAMPAGGTLHIETRPFVLGPPTPSGRPLRRCLSMAVADTGCGMDDTTLTRIYDPFFTTKPGGTGIGLATVKRLVREARGQIRVESSPGTGTTFWILLPEEA
jgi:signal transduction histidine kinase